MGGRAGDANSPGRLRKPPAFLEYDAGKGAMLDFRMDTFWRCAATGTTRAAEELNITSLR